jgi:hypothetical protein
MRGIIAQLKLSGRSHIELGKGMVPRIVELKRGHGDCKETVFQEQRQTQFPLLNS